MLFSSLIFLVCFLPCVLFFYYVLLRKSRKLQNYFLLLASLGFYAWGEPWFVLIMILSICANYGFGLWVNRHRNEPSKAKGVIALSLIFNLSIIFIFKYLMFTVANINLLFGTAFSVGNIALPIGISFFTFQAISYVIDIYRGKGQVQRNVLNVGLYISFFPQLIAGPIVRYETIANQIQNRVETFDLFSSGVCRFLVGYAKKIFLANNLAVIADMAFATSKNGGTSVTFAWMGAFAYTLQIYYDFSGYSDMAIGLGRMFGFEFLENFNYPYISKTVSEFWRRWHMSLGTWFRDYVYITLGGSRVSKFRLGFNLFIVWSLTGLWHGANWTFICWGLMYFVLLALEKFSGFEKCISQLDNEPLTPKAAAIFTFSRFYTLMLVMFGWVFFRADTLSDAINYFSIMFGATGLPLSDKFAAGYMAENLWYLIFALIFSMPIMPKLIDKIEKKIGTHSILFCVLYAMLLIAGLIFATSYLVKGAYNPFIYFNF